jgi:cytochrome c-type biogenesis protein CcmE
LFKKKRFLIGGIIILAAIVFLGIQGFKSSAEYYYTVNETIAKGAAIYGQSLRVNGTVTGTINNDVQTLTLKFNIADGSNSIPVVYKGSIPDNFGPDTDVVVGGTIDASGVLQANSIVTKCPSKYAAQN